MSSKAYGASQLKGFCGQGPGLPPLPGKKPSPPTGVPSPNAYCGSIRRSHSATAIRYKGVAPRLSPLKHHGHGTQQARTEDMAATEPTSRLRCCSLKVLDLARQAEEVLKVGDWSVRKLPDNPEIAFVYLNEQEGRVEVQAPTEVIQELQDEGLHPADGRENEELEEAEPCPLYRRILLGAHTEVPLRMARDILEAIREDVEIFQEVQQRFSDLPDEALLSLEDDLGEELEAVALAMQPGEVSEVLGTEAGMQILLRVR
mmetsp:Transcript_63407/g.100839  ORF Transcript_63407/g.100839 Transcript_63407/m.100839 type:complete len:259 (+) Transcript_63407:58-834(+)